MSLGYLLKVIKRVIREISIVDIILLVLGVAVLQTRIHEKLSPPLGYLLYKAILVSLGFIHARITRIVVYGRVNWNVDEIKPKHILAIVIYAVFIIAYSLGA